ncbi:MAG: T9SS type A sorting domain-containing protein [Flavipsychrobacter sp.]|nr:T9SS type A sorting domain-containing protein [Flavipsychrobacter sp.]
MKKLHIIWLLVSLLFSGGLTHAQSTTVPCPPGIDFETGLSAWSYYVGTCCPLVAETLTSAISCRHTLTSASGLVGCSAGASATDQYGGFPIACPAGGTQSLRIGDLVNGAQAEKARYYVTVPAGTSSYALLYHYAIVFQNPSHAPSMQPRFETNAFDTTAGWTPLAGAHHTYIAGGVLPGFIINSACPTCVPVANASQPVQYRDWATATIDLSGLGGHVVAVDFMNGDCSPGGHFSYGYVDVACGLFEISATISCDTTWTLLSAPPGYENYTWYDSASFTTTYSNGWVPVSPTPASYAVILQPYPGFGPTDTLYTTISCPTTTNIATHEDRSGTVRLFPNPAGNELMVGNRTPCETELTISNTVGLVISRHHLSAGQDRINIDHLPSGIYTATIRTPAGTELKRFLKQ